MNARPSPRDSGSPNPKGSVRPESNGHGRCIRTKGFPLRRPPQREAFWARKGGLCFTLEILLLAPSIMFLTKEASARNTGIHAYSRARVNQNLDKMYIIREARIYKIIHRRSPAVHKSHPHLPRISPYTYLQLTGPGQPSTSTRRLPSSERSPRI